MQLNTCMKREDGFCSIVIHICQAHSLELRGPLVMFQSGFTFTVNWLMVKVFRCVGMVEALQILDNGYKKTSLFNALKSLSSTWAPTLNMWIK